MNRKELGILGILISVCASLAQLCLYQPTILTATPSDVAFHADRGTFYEDFGISAIRDGRAILIRTNWHSVWHRGNTLEEVLSTLGPWSGTTYRNGSLRYLWKIKVGLPELVSTFEETRYIEVTFNEVKRISWIRPLRWLPPDFLPR